MDDAPDVASKDDEYLDRLLDRTLSRLEAGEPVDLDILVADRPHLRARAQQIVTIARDVVAPSHSEPPTVAGYTIEREIGRGSTATVYLARHQRLDRSVALKVLTGWAPPERAARERFLAEARALARVRHAHVVAIHEIIESDTCCSIAMEWVEGRTLAAVLDDPAPQRPGAASREILEALGVDAADRRPEPLVTFYCRMAADLARALGEVHRAGLVHRDVKPQNVLLGRDGHAVLSDFGLVRDESTAGATLAGQFLGTVAYAAPEQLRGDHRAVGPRSDIYSLGATLYRTLAGRPPLSGRSVAEQLLLAEHGGAPSLMRFGLPRDLDTIVATCLDQDPNRRYASADLLAEDLERFLSFQPIHARRAGPWLRATRFARRHRAAVLTGAATCGVALVLAVVWGGAFVDRVTQQSRADEALRSARSILLDSGFGDALRFAHLERRPEHLPDATAEASSRLGRYERALRAYERVLDIDEEHAAAGLEFGVLRFAEAEARALAEQRSIEPPDAPSLRARCPRALAFLSAATRLEAPATDTGEATTALLAGMSRDDRHALGLFAYFSGRHALCLSSWEGLDLDQVAPDPFIDAAHGQALLAGGQSSAAYTRLASAARAFPASVVMRELLAECAIDGAESAQAERFLEQSRLAGVEPTERTILLGAEIRAVRGDLAGACDSLRGYLSTHGAPWGNLTLARLLARAARYPEALKQALVAQRSRGEDPRVRSVTEELAAVWWAGLTPYERWREVRTSLGTLDPARSVLGELLLVRDPPVAPPERTRVDEEFLADSPRTRYALTWPLPALTLWPSAARDLAAAVLLWRDRVDSTSAAADCGLLQFVARLTEAVATELARDDWVPRLSTHAPPGALYCTLAYDRGRRVSVLFGGTRSFYSLRYRGTAWEWDGRDWSAVGGSGPEARSGTALASLIDGGILLFGGQSQVGNMADTWILRDRRWMRCDSQTAPSPRIHAAMALDPGRGRIVLFGGAAGIGDRDDTWEWDGQAWQERHPSSRPPARYGHALAYDPVHRAILMHGGYKSRSAEGLADTWLWDGHEWTLVATGGLPARWHHRAVADESNGRVLLFGGYTDHGGVDETWEWDGDTWRQIMASRRPPARDGHGMAFDEVRHRMVIFGGSSSVGSGPTETWEFVPREGSLR